MPGRNGFLTRQGEHGRQGRRHRPHITHGTAMFTKPVRLMLTATAILFVLVMWNVDDQPGDKVEVPDLGAVANGMAGQ